MAASCVLRAEPQFVAQAYKATIKNNRYFLTKIKQTGRWKRGPFPEPSAGPDAPYKKGENQSPPFCHNSWNSYFAGAGAGAAGAAIGASVFVSFFAFFAAFFFVAFFSFAGFSGAAAAFSGAAAGAAAGAWAKPVAAKATAITTANTNINTFFILPYLRLCDLVTSCRM
jgi:hypothetical protein